MSFNSTKHSGVEAIDVTALRNTATLLEQKIEDLRKHDQVLTAQNDLFAATIDLMSEGLCLFDGEQRLVVSNRRYAEMYDIPPELLLPGTALREIIQYRIENGYFAGNDPEEYIREWLEWVTRGKPGSMVQTLSDGRMIRISYQPTADGGWLTTHTDITKLERLNFRFHTALNNMSQGLCMFDKEKRLLVWNDRYIEMYDLPSEIAKPGTPFRSILEHRVKSGVYSGEDPEAYIQERLDAVEETKPTTKIQELTNGRVIVIVHQPMEDGGWVATHEDITELQRVQEQVTYMAHHDALTGLPNRTLFRERLEQVLPQTRRDKSFAILCLDLDCFKNVNDTLGHPVGDELLIAVAERLKDCVRESDTIARLGGDEFAIIQASDNMPRDATTLATRICEVISQPFDLDEHQVAVGASVGIAIAPNDGDDPDHLLKNADMALYRAKNDGRGIYRFFEQEMDARMQERRELKLDLLKALKGNQFELHYQPLVSLESEEVTGFEALLRWRHPERGMVSPVDFISIAEDTGLIIPLGEWVIRTACQDAASWPHNVRVAVNISPVQFRSPKLVPTVFSALATSGVAAGRLELEITESVLLQDNPTTMKTLHQLRDIGVRIVMDNFGTGYSSLSYLRSFPFDKIKIDRSFVSDLSGDENSNAIVIAVASYSRSLGISTTAEGVETEEQREEVKAAGYTEMQGFLFSPARPVGEIAKMFFPESDEKSAASV